MAYLARYQPGQNLISGGGAAPAGGASDPAAPQQPAASGAYTDFGAYLRANGDASQQMAQRITRPLQNEVASAAQAPQFQALQPVSQDNPFAVIGGTARNLPAILANGQAASTANAAREKASSDLAASAAPGWAESQLRGQAGANYTPGMGRLDAFLANAGGAGEQMNALRQKYAGMLNPVDAPKQQVTPAAKSQPAAPQPVPSESDLLTGPKWKVPKGYEDTYGGSDPTAWNGSW